MIEKNRIRFLIMEGNYRIGDLERAGRNKVAIIEIVVVILQ